MNKANDKQIQEWKKQYGDVYALPVEDKIAYLRAPKMPDYKRAFVAMQKNGDVAFGEEMLNSLFIGGDTEIKTNDEYFTPARKRLIDFFEYDDAEFVTIDGTNNTQITIGEHKCIVRMITRNDLKTAERKNPSNKPFVTQEKLFDAVVVEKSDAFNDRNNAEIRFPLYKAIEELQNKKVAWLEKL